MNRRARASPALVFLLAGALSPDSADAGDVPAAASAGAKAKTPLGPGALLSASDGTVSGADGDWAEYAQLDQGTARLDETFRIIALGDPTAEDRKVEIWMDKTGFAAARVTLGKGTAEKPSPVLLKLGAAVYELEGGPVADGLRCGGPGACAGQTTESGERSGGQRTSLTTIGGTFKALKLKKKDGTVLWYSEEIPVLRLVRLVHPSGIGYELVAHGHQLASSFPKKFKPRVFPAAQIEAMLRGLMPSITAVPKAAAACDPATSSCTPGAPPPVPVLKPYVPPEKRPKAP